MKRQSRHAKPTLRHEVNLLGDLGSDGDPIEYHGEETTPLDLMYQLGSYTPQDKVKVTYWSIVKYDFPNRLKIVKNGTLAGMVKDRQRKLRRATLKSRAARRVCPTCLRSL